MTRSLILRIDLKGRRWLSRMLPALLFACCIAGLTSQTLGAPRATPRKLAPLKANPVQVARLIRNVNVPAMRRALDDLERIFPESYPASAGLRARLDEIERQLPDLQARLETKVERAKTEGWSPKIVVLANPDPAAVEAAEKTIAFQRELLIARNPLVDFDEILMTRQDKPSNVLTSNWMCNSSINLHNKKEGTSDIVRWRLDQPFDEAQVVFHPDPFGAVVDMDLHWDGTRLLFSHKPNIKGAKWDLYEIDIDGTDFRKVDTINDAGIDNFDACYLPNEDIIFASTACQKVVPCFFPANVVNLYRLHRETGQIRQLTFDQDQNWYPTVTSAGQVLYCRWEYTGLPHFVARILFLMNPDGTSQMQHYGGNTYWPNSVFYARPCPGNSLLIAGVVTGHHGTIRRGELTLFDLSRADSGAAAAVQRIPGYGQKVEPVIRDDLVGPSWPKFLHPYPLGRDGWKDAAGKFFLVSMQLDKELNRGKREQVLGDSLYVVDVYDNLTPLVLSDDDALLEPMPVRPRKRPPVIADRVDPTRKDGSIFIQDIYLGEGLKGVPRGTIKNLRIVEYDFGYQHHASKMHKIGIDGPWDIMRIVGTVEVEPDGSACFEVPANRPLTLQPLDENGEAVQLMRSWLTVRPGEQLVCVGCHESRRQTPPAGPRLANMTKPRSITSWHGPPRGFSFPREVQPVLDRHCVGCHDGSRQDGKTIPDFSKTEAMPAPNDEMAKGHDVFTGSYYELRRHVRGHTMEGDMEMLTPGEHKANTTRLLQLLDKGHHGVQLEPEGRERIVTWIDLNTPCWGTWMETFQGKTGKEFTKTHEGLMKKAEIRARYLRQFANVDYATWETFPISYAPADPPTARNEPARKAKPVTISGWPFSAEEAAKRQTAGGEAARNLTFGEDSNLTLRRIPAGSFVMGDATGHPDRRPQREATIAKDFWISSTEVTNRLFRLYDAAHDSRMEPHDNAQFCELDRGWPANDPDQPVVRVSFDQAQAFCGWLSDETGKTCRLPTEEEWEYACRAGSATPLWWGGIDVDFSKFANLADKTFAASQGIYAGKDIRVVPWRPGIETVNDGNLVAAPVGSYMANPWGLHDMHGNVSEWTSTPGRMGTVEGRIVRGGSWYDRPQYATASHRVSYPTWQKVYDVGFRIVVEGD
jgi:formylglycine-generating enzyme required for sulfatase activity